MLFRQQLAQIAFARCVEPREERLLLEPEMPWHVVRQMVVQLADETRVVGIQAVGRRPRRSRQRLLERAQEGEGALVLLVQQMADLSRHGAAPFKVIRYQNTELPPAGLDSGQAVGPPYGAGRPSPPPRSVPAASAASFSTLPPITSFSTSEAPS